MRIIKPADTVDGQIGLEPTPDIYISRLVQVFGEARRALKESSTLWIVISDSYAGSGKRATNTRKTKKYKQGTSAGMLGARKTLQSGDGNCKPKDLIEIPWMLAGCPDSGVVLDMFAGSGTVGVVAEKIVRDYILFDLNPQYIEIARERIEEHQYNLKTV